MKYGYLIPAITSSLVLLACGGGGSTGSVTSNILPITVATGAPVEGASVTVVDSRGTAETCAQTTSSTGVVNCALSSSMTAPYFIQASKGTVALYAVLPDTASRVNVTPISTAMAKKFAADNGVQPEQIIGQPAVMATTNRATAQAAVELINAIIKVVAAQTAGISIDNALTQQYTAAQTDSLDRVIHNMHITTDSSGVTVTIPTAAGTMNVNVAFNTTKQAAETAVTSSTQNVTADLSDGTLIDQAIDSFLSSFATCTNPASKAAIVNMIDARSYTINGAPVKFMEGRPLADWVDRLCEADIGTLKRIYTKSLARYGNKIILVIGVKTVSGNEVEIPLAMIKRNGTWKLLSDNMLVNHSTKTRHALELTISEWDNTEKFTYRRYLDTWIDERIQYALMPDKIELYAIPLKEVTDKWTPTAFGQLTPFLTIYKSNAQVCTNHIYTLDPNRGSGNVGCNSSADDSSIQSVFTMLENNEFTHIIFKQIDSSGACMNCDGGIPESGALIGKAYSFESLFGKSITQSQLTAGLDRSKMPAAAITSYRTFFAAPSEADLTSLSKLFLSNTTASTVRIPWARATKSKSQIDGNWGGFVVCGQNGFTSFEEPSFSVVSSPDYWDVTFPSPNKSYGGFSWMSFTIANRVHEAEFAYYINVRRKCAT